MEACNSPERGCSEHRTKQEEAKASITSYLLNIFKYLKQHKLTVCVNRVVQVLVAGVMMTDTVFVFDTSFISCRLSMKVVKGQSSKTFPALNGRASIILNTLSPSYNDLGKCSSDHINCLHVVKEWIKSSTESEVLSTRPVGSPFWLQVKSYWKCLQKLPLSLFICSQVFRDEFVHGFLVIYECRVPAFLNQRFTTHKNPLPLQ